LRCYASDKKHYENFVMDIKGGVACEFVGEMFAVTDIETRVQRALHDTKVIPPT